MDTLRHPVYNDSEIGIHDGKGSDGNMRLSPCQLQSPSSHNSSQYFNHIPPVIGSALAVNILGLYGDTKLQPYHTPYSYISPIVEAMYIHSISSKQT